MKHYLVKELYTKIPSQDLPEVKVNGWVRTMRESKAFAFVELNDGTYFRNLQVILEEAKLNNYREATRQIGVGAVVFFALYNNRIKDIDFYWDRALNFEGETGPYVMYTHARACSVLRKAGACDAKPDFAALSDPESQDVVRVLEQFPEVLKAAINKSEPSMVTRYSVDLAQAFNKFYYERKVMVDDLGERAARIALTRAVKQTIAKALDLIGLEAPERM